MRLEDSGVECHESNADQDGQFLLRVYRDHHGVTRTIAWRADVGSTWGPEHLLFPEPVASSQGTGMPRGSL